MPPSHPAARPDDARPDDARRRHDARRDRWIAHRARRRQEFVAAALRVLRDTGPDLPMGAVAAQAGVTKPVLYRYFADKAALIQALGEFASGLLRERLVPALIAGGPAMARIRGGVGAYFAIIDEHPDLYWLLTRHGAGDSTGEGGDGAGLVARQKEFIATTLTAVYGDYLRAYGLDSGAAEPWAFGITGLVQSTGEWWLTRRSMSRAQVTEHVSQLIWWALTGVLRDAGITADPDGPVPVPLLVPGVRPGGLAAPRRPR
jgi:AcrR family transcriptional regulator